MTKLQFLGHACFLLQKDDVALIFDPYLTDNPFKIAKPEDIKCKYVLLSHGHFDHLGDAIDIARRNNATVISTAEIANLCAEKGCQVHAMHLGGKHQFEFGTVRITLAFHGAGVPGGHACGFVVDFYDTKVYFAGDTGLFGDMELIGRLEKIDYALLPIGDNFTMGPADAAEAAGMIKPKVVIPMHYNTWPLIEQDPHAYKADVEKRFNIPVHILNPGETLTIA